MKTWKTVKLGVHKTGQAYRKTLEQKGYRISDTGYADQIIDNIEISQTEIELDLLVITVGELGFRDITRRHAIFRRVKEMGLGLCPAEVGPALRLAYPDQPINEWLMVGMEAVLTGHDFQVIFTIGCNGDGYWLDGFTGFPMDFSRPDRLWVFTIPSNS